MMAPETTPTPCESQTQLRLPRFAHIAACTHAGYVRARNEDHYGIDEPRDLVVVADGVASCDDGARAAELAVQAVLERYADVEATWPDEGTCVGGQLARQLESAVLHANRCVHKEACERQVHLSTTVVAAVLGAEQFVVAHVGDSRAYLLRRGSLRRLTRDHNYAEDAGDDDATLPIARSIPGLARILTRTVGTQPLVEVAVVAAPLEAGDTLLLCTDGLSSYVSEDAVTDLLIANVPLGAAVAADALVHAALSAGAPDNVTVAVFHVFAALLPPRNRGFDVIG